MGDRKRQSPGTHQHIYTVRCRGAVFLFSNPSENVVVLSFQTRSSFRELLIPIPRNEFA